MAPRGKLHLLDPACLAGDLDRVSQRIWSRCRRVNSWRSNLVGAWPTGASPGDALRLIADGGVWASLPRAIQCDYCYEVISLSASQRDILSVALFCGGLAGALDPVLAALVAAYVVGDEPSRDVALDLAEQRGLDRGCWPVVEREWLEVARRHEHVWLTAIGVDVNGRRGTMSVRPGGPLVRRCPCGVYEHEAAAHGQQIGVRALPGGWRQFTGLVGRF